VRLVPERRSTVTEWTRLNDAVREPDTGLRLGIGQARRLR
jgi:hypothetical protein